MDLFRELGHLQRHVAVVRALGVVIVVSGRHRDVILRLALAKLLFGQIEDAVLPSDEIAVGIQFLQELVVGDRLRDVPENVVAKPLGFQLRHRLVAFLGELLVVREAVHVRLYRVHRLDFQKLLDQRATRFGAPAVVVEHVKHAVASPGSRRTHAGEPALVRRHYPCAPVRMRARGDRVAQQRVDVARVYRAVGVEIVVFRP